MNITWLGQSGYLLDCGDHRVVIDPFFSDIVERQQGLRRSMPPPRSIQSLSPDALLVTHDHLDHFDPETVAGIMATAPNCRLLGSVSVVDHGKKTGIPERRLVLVTPDTTVQFEEIFITATPVRHSDPAAVGLLVRTRSELLWFSGHTLYFPELSRQVRLLADRAPDMVFVCINGRLGNMNLAEAGQLTAELQPRVAIPMHNRMFAENTADPAEYSAGCARRGPRAAVLECGCTVSSATLLAKSCPAPSPRFFA